MLNLIYLKNVIVLNYYRENKMTKTYEGIFENSYVVFKEVPEIPKNAKVKVIFEEKGEGTVPKKRKLGTMKGNFKMSDDFDEPLEELKDYM